MFLAVVGLLLIFKMEPDDLEASNSLACACMGVRTCAGGMEGGREGAGAEISHQKEDGEESLPTRWHIHIHDHIHQSAKEKGEAKATSGAPFPLACPRATPVWWRASPTRYRCRHHPPFSIWLQKEDKREWEKMGLLWINQFMTIQCFHQNPPRG